MCRTSDDGVVFYLMQWKNVILSRASVVSHPPSHHAHTGEVAARGNIGTVVKSRPLKRLASPACYLYEPE